MSRSRNEGDGASTSSRDNDAEPSKASTCVDVGTLTEEGKANEHSPTSSCMNAAGADTWSEVPMLAKLVKEAETAKFYAYCEEVCWLITWRLNLLLSHVQNLWCIRIKRI